MGSENISKQTPVIRMENITKRFGGVYAVRDVNFELYEGEVLALVGDNGAGKSTLMKILSGALIADEGSIYLRGEKVKIETPMDSRRLGIETLYQNLALVNSLDIPANVFMGREIRSKGILGQIGMMNLKQMKEKSFELLDDFKINVPALTQEVKNLSGGQRQMVSISRSVLFDASIIIMDEPTAALGVAETNKVYHFINRVKEKGISVIIISHNINEVYNVADRFMIMKTGGLVGIKNKTETDIDDIVAMIISGKSG
jgi:ABC-type sugar transport system ATPase subunit